MKNVTAFVCIVVSMSLIFCSCNKQQVAPDDHTNVVALPTGGDAVVQANNTFAFNFLHATLQQDGADNNKLISPLSIYLALSMVYNGAANATKDSIARVLQLSGMDINVLNAVCNSLITQLPGEDNRVAFSIANSIWYNQNNYQPLPSFLSTVQSAYEATAQPAKFGDPSAADAINHWASDQTHGKIPDILDATSADDLMYLLNAIYFKGAWQMKFSPSNTRNSTFYTSSGTVTVPFMTNKITTRIYRDSLFTLAELPYGGGNSYSMFIALPNDRQISGNAFASSFTQTMLTDAINDMDSVSVEITIPKWEYRYKIDNMQPALSLLGMGKTFSDEADFSAMYNSSQTHPYITKAIHKTYIKVDEEGTDAAAVTAIGIGTTTSLPNSFVFTADHPFVYAIVEKQTGAVLFTGILNAPNAD